MLGELSFIKFTVLRIADEVEQLPKKIAAEMGRVNNPEEAKRPDPGSEKH